MNPKKIPKSEGMKKEGCQYIWDIASMEQRLTHLETDLKATLEKLDKIEESFHDHKLDLQEQFKNERHNTRNDFNRFKLELTDHFDAIIEKIGKKMEHVHAKTDSKIDDTISRIQKVEERNSKLDWIAKVLTSPWKSFGVMILFFLFIVFQMFPEVREELGHVFIAIFKFTFLSS